MLRRLLVPLMLSSALLAQDGRRHGPGPHQGLPADPTAFRPYHAEANHPANRLFQLLWLRQQAPAEVAAPADPAPVEWTKGWVHRKRDGGAADTRWFGGDGRLLPLETLDAAASATLRERLAALRAAPLDLPAPLLVLLQHDLLRAAERLADVAAPAELVGDLVTTARAIALPAAALAALPSPLDAARAADPALAAALPKALGGRGELREVLRRSTRLFDAEKSLLWSRVFLAHPAGDAALATLLPAARPGAKDAPEVPLGMRAVLVQGLVAVDRDGVPRATPLVIDVREQVLSNRDGLGADNPTFTHDGIDFTIWQLERQGLRQADPAAFFRRIAPDDQDLFRDYGTSKHTTWRGQCSLCHRNTDTPEPQLGGFPVLRPHAQAAFASTGDERLRLAETQVATLLGKLASLGKPAADR